MRDLYIIGAGGFGREVAWLVERINVSTPTWKLRGFIDDNESLKGKEVGGYKVVGPVESMRQMDFDFWAVCAIGSSITRKSIIDKVADFPHIHFATLVDPDAKMSPRVLIGDGSIICAGNNITVDVNIGKHNIINLGCTVGHDVVLENFVTLYPGANISGAVRVGAVTELGTGMQIIQGKKIGANTIIGAGTVVIRDIPANCTAVGNPARIIKC